MAFLTEEMQADTSSTPQLRDQLDTLRRQVLRCRDAIDQLAAATGEIRASAGHAGELGEWLMELVERWRRAHPQAEITLRLSAQVPTMRLLLDRAVSSLVLNAVRVSPKVEIVGRWDHAECVLEVLDLGPGIPTELAPLIGRTPLGRRHGVTPAWGWSFIWPPTP